MDEWYMHRGHWKATQKAIKGAAIKIGQCGVQTDAEEMGMHQL